MAEPYDEELDIAVVGMATRFSGAEDLDAFWRLLLEGRDGSRQATEEEFFASGGTEVELKDPDLVLRYSAIDGIERLDAEYFGFSPAEAELMDPQHRLFLEIAHRALEHAGHDPADPDRVVGVYAGSGLASYLLRNVMPWYQDSQADLMTLATGNAPSTLATRVAYRLGLTGPAMAVATACSTSLVAVHLACQDLIGLRTDVALAGGATLNPAARRGYRWVDAGLMSADGRCRPFDAAATGMAGGDGVAAVVLKRLADARADGDTIYGVIAGTAVNNDGRRKVGYAAPSTQGQAEVIVAAHAAAGLTAADIDYVEAHGTGTAVGDPVEVAALTSAFLSGGAPPESCGLGAVKSNVGHTDTAAGVAGLIKTVLALHHERIPATAHYTEPNPLIDFAGGPFRVVAEETPWPRGERPRAAGVSSFGIGGTNAHVVVREAPRPPDRSSPTEAPQLLLLSARSPEALRDSCAELAGHLRAHPGLDLADVARTLHEGRRAGPYRASVVAPGRSGDAVAETAELLESQAAALASAPVEPARSARPVVLLYGGAGAVPGDAVAELARFSRPFADALASAGRLLGTELGELIGSGGLPDPADDEAGLSPAAVLAVEFALTDLLRSVGITPTRVLGHSLGEYAAAAVAEVMDRAEAVRLVARRQVLLDATHPDGAGEAMLADPSELGELPDGLTLAVYTAPGSCLVSGTRSDLDAWLAGLPDIPHRPLPVRCAPHSPLLEPAREPLRALLAAVRMAAPRLPWVTTVTGAVATEERARDVDAWLRHTLEPVDFAAALRTAAGRAKPAFIEVGPGRAAARAARTVLGPPTPAVPLLPTPISLVPTSHVADSDVPSRGFHPAVTALLTSLGALWCAGVDLDGTALRPPDARKVPLPGHPWYRRRYWIDPPAPGTVTPAPGGRIPAGTDPEPAGPAKPTGPAGAGVPRPALPNAYVPPETDRQRRLVELCGAVLGYTGIGLDDDVFALGADSLTAFRLVQRTRAELGAAPPLREFLEDPRVRNLEREPEPAPEERT